MKVDSLELVHDHDSRFIALWQLLCHYLRTEGEFRRTGIVDVVIGKKLMRYEMRISFKKIGIVNEIKEIRRLKRRIENMSREKSSIGHSLAAKGFTKIPLKQGVKATPGAVFDRNPIVMKFRKNRHQPIRTQGGPGGGNKIICAICRAENPADECKKEILRNNVN